MLATADLCDDHEDKLATGELRVLAPIFKSYGGRPHFSGPIATLKIFEDNSLVRDHLERPGEGRVLFVDGGGSLRCALLGGNMGVLAAKNGWEGIVINGCVRDVEEIKDCDVGIWALASMPVKSFKRGQGQENVPVTLGGARISPGEWCYGDSDGIIISAKPLTKL